MVLVARTDTGFATAYWKDDNVLLGNGGNAWSDWQIWQFAQQPAADTKDVNPPQDWTGFIFQDGPIPPGWPLLGWFEQDGVARVNGFFAFGAKSPADPRVAVGAPWYRIP